MFKKNIERQKRRFKHLRPDVRKKAFRLSSRTPFVYFLLSCKGLVSSILSLYIRHTLKLNYSNLFQQKFKYYISGFNSQP